MYAVGYVACVFNMTIKQRRKKENMANTTTEENEKKRTPDRTIFQRSPSKRKTVEGESHSDLLSPPLLLTKKTRTSTAIPSWPFFPWGEQGHEQVVGGLSPVLRILTLGPPPHFFSDNNNNNINQPFLLSHSLARSPPPPMYALGCFRA